MPITAVGEPIPTWNIDRPSGHPYETVCVGIRKGAEQHAIHYREDRRVGADGHGQSQDRNHREAAIVQKRAEPQTDVLPKVTDPTEPSDVAVVLLHLIDTAEATARSESSLPWAHPLPEVFLGGHVEMGANLLVQLVIEPTSVKCRDQLV